MACAIFSNVTEKSPHVITKEEAELYDDAEHVEIEVDEGQITFEEMDIKFVDPDDPNDPLAFFAEALPSNFTREQVELLRALAYNHKPSDVEYGPAADLWLYDYLEQKTKLMKATPGVMNPFGWMRRAVMEDWK